MEKLNKAHLAEQINLIENKLKELSKNKFRYFIYGKYIPGYGDIKLLETHEDLIKCFNFVKSNFHNKKIEDTANELGIRNSTKLNEEEQTYLGYTLPEWKEEFKTKVKEIQNLQDIEALKKAKKDLKKHLSEEDKLNSEFNKISDTLYTLGINVNHFISEFELSDEFKPSPKLEEQPKFKEENPEIGL